MRQKMDKIMAVGGFGLLGYYLGLSLLRSPILSLFYWILPPINTRHLPLYFTGLFSVGLFAPLGYLLYTLFLQRYPIASHKKQYLISSLSLVLLPILVLGFFRMEAVGIVERAENSTPTNIFIRIDYDSIMFWIDESAGLRLGKSIQFSREHKALDEIGKAVHQLKRLDVAPNTPGMDDYVLFIDYRSKGKWYSKILAYSQGLFKEYTTRNNTFYEGGELERLLQNQVGELENIYNFTQASILHSSRMSRDQASDVSLSDNDFKALVSFIQDANKITPEADAVSHFNYLFDNGIPANSQNLYGIHLKNDPASSMLLDNCMVYDKDLKLLWFEGDYYQADLSPIIDKVQ